MSGGLCHTLVAGDAELGRGSKRVENLLIFETFRRYNRAELARGRGCNRNLARGPQNH